MVVTGTLLEVEHTRHIQGTRAYDRIRGMPLQPGQLIEKNHREGAESTLDARQSERPLPAPDHGLDQRAADTPSGR